MLELFIVLIAAVAVERLLELVVAARHRRWAQAHGGVEYGAAHYPFIVAAQVGLLVGAPVEAWLRQLHVPIGFAVTMTGCVLAAQALRWWCIATLGRSWNTRVIIVPGSPRIRRGPYRLLPHPNYLAVVVEGAALPLAGGAWLTAVTFTTVNAALLVVRIRTEDRALRRLRPTDERAVHLG